MTEKNTEEKKTEPKEDSLSNMFPSLSQMRIDVEKGKIPAPEPVQIATVPIKKGRIPKIDTDLMDKNKEQLWEVIFTEEVDPEIFEEKLRNYVRVMPKTASALKGIREMYEDKLQINELRDIIMAGRGTKDKKGIEANNEQEDANQQEASDVLTMLSMMQNRNGKGNLNTNDPLMLYTLLNSMSGQRKGGGMNNPLILLSLTQLLNQMQNPQQTQQIGNTQQPNINMEIIKEVINNIKASVQQPADTISPDLKQLVFLTNLFNRSGGQPDNSQLATVLAKMTEIMQSNKTNELNLMMQQNQQFQQSITKALTEALYSIRESRNPRQDFMEDFQLVNSILGNQRSKSDAELAIEIEREKLKEQRLARQDEMRLRQDEAEREHNKSMRYVELGSNILKNLTGGEGIGNIIGAIGNARSKSTKKRPSRPSDISNDDLDFL